MAIAAASKAAAIDGMSPKKTALVSGVFIGLLFLIAVASVNSPNAATFREFPFTLPCNASACNVTASVQLSDLSPWNQATWVTMRMERPTQIVNGVAQPIRFDYDYSMQLRWWGTITLDGSTGATGGANVSHLTTIFCPKMQTTCSSVLLLAQPWIQSTSYGVSATFQDPLASLDGVVANLVPEVRFTIRQGFIDERYTSFELGWKVAFIVFTCIFFVWYIARQFLGPGNKDESGAWLRTNPQQVFVAVLAALLFWFNDPFYIAYITMPTLATAGAQAFFTATFVCLLLLWFLVAFDLARLQGENGVGWDPVTADPATRPGLCFWLPKILLIAIIWTLTLSAYVYVRYSQLTDPAFSVVEAAGPYWPFLQTFVGGLIGLYILYGFGILVLAFRRFKSMSQSNKFVTAVTVTSLCLIMVGVLSSGFLGTRSGAALRAVTYGCANLYVWFLMFIYRPAAKPDAWAGVPSSEGAPPAGMAPPAPWTGEAKPSTSPTKGAEAQAEEGEVQVTVSTDGEGVGGESRADRVRRMSRPGQGQGAAPAPSAPAAITAGEEQT